MKKTGFTGMVKVPFLASEREEHALYLADLRAKAEIIRENPKDFDAALTAALHAIRLGHYDVAREFTVHAANLTPYYNEIIRDLFMHLQTREKKLQATGRVDPAIALGKGTIHVAMLTYNALEYTQQCLHSLLSRTRRPLEIHIRENASQDGTAAWLRSLEHPRIHVEYGEDNRGVPGGRNRLIEMIRPVAGPEDFVVFLDNDIEMLDGWEDHYLEFFATHPQVGIASAVGQRMVVEANGRRLLDPKDGPAPVDVALGGYACWMRVAAMFATGGYDENLGLFWHEDDDLCVRALGLGIDVWAVPGAPLVHHGHKSGVALTGLGAGGSPKNLAYLADKWRKLGLILPNGEVDRSAVGREEKAASECLPAAEPATERGPDRKRWNLPADAILFGHGFDMAEDVERQNPTDVIQAFAQAFGNREDVALCIRVENADANPGYRAFVENVSALTRSFGNIFYSTESLSAPEVAGLLSCWDAAVFLHLAYGPGSRIPDCMAMGIPVVATAGHGNPDLLHAGNALLVPHADGAVAAMLRLAGDADLRRTLGDCAREEAGRSAGTDRKDWIPGPRAGRGAGLKVLLQSRYGAETAPGGDTMVMDRYREELTKLGVSVTVDHEPTVDYRKFDLAHLFNMVLPDNMEPLARAAHAVGVPFVVQALQEDQSAYEGQSRAMAIAIASYVHLGQAKGSLAGFLAKAKKFEIKTTKTSPFAAAHARAVICNSLEEAGYVRKLHPDIVCTVIPYGADQQNPSIGPEMFEKAFGVKDFILCVGRLEDRKNQLALQAALEDEDMPLVLANGGVCYYPDYADYSRKLKRKGPTLFTGWMAPDMLTSCYRAARAHVLPSWQELPGLVTLEAALQGCNVAATPHGGIREYMGKACVYFEPDDLPGIRKAALAAFTSPRTGEPAAVARQFTWESTVKRVLETYHQVLSGNRAAAETVFPAAGH